ncbi:argininosuccinate lyase [Flavobacterium sediminilitoris]|uniref:Argininosuccinate lyase n=1 Tax=Flavobacterium sediminilitoris TaxID=2024526 RepID=A0ABY4HLD7_9FLAO|nr:MULTISPECIES: argininosuccinate lyase [Flavobacterium]UOX33656.1 argininosuccinate lyase [Flavobacterium sediminilitoris]
MATKIWQKTNHSNLEHTSIVEQFTVGNDIEFDYSLAKYDVQGSLAHCEMLHSIGLLNDNEWQLIEKELKVILTEIKANNFEIEEGIEDVHSQVEHLLIQRIGDIGKKIHSGRSRNDQVLTDLKLYFKAEILDIVSLTETLFNTLIQLSNQHKNTLLPGYTHLQIAMPSSFGLWFGAYAESLIDDLEVFLAAYNIVNKNPLGSGAGYGTSFPLNRTLTTELLNFKTLNVNSVYAQMTRGKSEKIVGMALATMAGTLSKFAFDMCLYLNQNFGFISFPDSLTTGSSIMPHKKNPDVFEIMRAKCNRIQAVPNELILVTNNLPSGYHRDVQLTKEILFPALTSLKDCLEMFDFMLAHIQIKPEIVKDEKYKYMFSVENVNQQVLDGIAFRDAYKNIGLAIENNTFEPNYAINHSHEGSIGNLGNDLIVANFEEVKSRFE